MSWKEDLRTPDLTSETFTEIMAEAAQERLDADVQVTARLELRADVSEHVALQCNLRGLWQKDIEGSAPGARQGPCEDYLRGLQERVEQQERAEQQGGSGSPVAGPDPSDLRPILQSRAFVEQANETYKDAGLSTRLLAEPLAADLHVAYVADQPRSISFLSSQDLARLEMTREEMAERARRNLREAFQETELGVLTLENEGITTYKVTADGIFASSLPLIPEVPERLAEQVEGTLVAVVPARDELFFAGDNHHADVVILREMGEKLFEEDRHPVSRSLITWRNGQWEVYQEV